MGKIDKNTKQKWKKKIGKIKKGIRFFYRLNIQTAIVVICKL